MKIHFQNKLHPSFSGKYTHYHHQKIKSNTSEYCDIRSFIKNYNKKWFKSIEAWHSQFCSTSSTITPYWWFIKGSRLYLWLPPIFKPLVFAVAILEYCKAFKLNEITLLECPQEVLDYLQELQPTVQYIIDPKLKLQPFFKPSPFNNILISLYQLIQIFLKSFLNLSKRPNLDKIKLLIHSQLVAVNNNDQPDHFYGTMLDDIPNIAKNEALWLYLSKSRFSKNNKMFIQNAEKMDKSVLIIQDLIRPMEAAKIALVCLKLFFSFKKIQSFLPQIKIGKYQSSLFPKNYFLLLINNNFPINELETYFAVKKILSQAPQLNKIHYPYEEKGGERALLQAIRESSKKVISLGYSHSIHWNLHYYFHIRPSPSSNPPRPNIYTVTGPSEKQWLIEKAGVRPEKIKIVGSSRYTSPLTFPFNKKFWKHNLRVLVMLGQPVDPNILANYLDDDPTIFENCEMIIRKYPFDGDYEQEEGIHRIRKYVKNLKVDTETPLKEQLLWCDTTLYNSSSTGLIAMLSGRIAVNVDLHDIFYWDPMEKEGSDQAVIQCLTAIQLKKTITKLRNLDEEEYSTISQRQRNFALSIYAPPDKLELSRLLAYC